MNRNASVEVRVPVYANFFSIGFECVEWINWQWWEVVNFLNFTLCLGLHPAPHLSINIILLGFRDNK